MPDIGSTSGILGAIPGLNWLLLVELVTIVVAALFWFFFLNRFIVRPTPRSSG